MKEIYIVSFRAERPKGNTMVDSRWVYQETDMPPVFGKKRLLDLSNYIF